MLALCRLLQLMCQTFWASLILILFARWNNVYSQSPLEFYQGDAVSFSCPNESGWYHVGLHCYKVVTNKALSWHEAKSHCEKFGSTLITETVAAQIAKLSSYGFVSLGITKRSIKPDSTWKYQFWTGLRINASDPSTNSITMLQQKGTTSTSVISIYSPLWASQQPTFGDSRDCVSVNLDIKNTASFGWTNLKCSEHFPFICQLQTCVFGQFRCANNWQCIPSQFACSPKSKAKACFCEITLGVVLRELQFCSSDGTEDCRDGSDEVNCPIHCGGTFEKQPNGIISSPNYPKNYPNNANCTWLIKAKRNSRITFSILDFDTEDSRDILELVDATSAWSAGFKIPPLSAIIGPQTITVSASVVSVRFTTDRSLTRKGFNISWNILPALEHCVETLTLSEQLQIFQTPGFDQQGLPAFTECIWTFNSTFNYPAVVVSLVWEQLELRHPDVLTVLKLNDSYSQSSTVLAVFSESTTVPTVMTLLTSKISISLRTGKQAGTKFKLSFKLGCNDVAIPMTYGTLLSPNYWLDPLESLRGYPLTIACSWILQSHSNVSSSLLFHSLELFAEDILTVHFLSAEDQKPQTFSSGSARLPGNLRVDLSSQGANVSFVLEKNRKSFQRSSSFNATFSVDCSPPLLTSKELRLTSNRNNFAYGSKLHFLCINGYEVFGAAEAVECAFGGIWNSSAPTCQAISCGKPPIPENGWLLDIECTEFECRAIYDCFYGYKFQAQMANFSRCGGDGLWKPVPLCKQIHCGKPKNPENGLSAWNPDMEDTQGSRIYYDCKPGYHAWGQPLAVCNSNEEWWNNGFQCRKNICPVQSFLFGKLVLKRNDSTVAHIVCNDPITAADSLGSNSAFKSTKSHVRCDATNQKWTPQPSCNDVNECETAPCRGPGAACNNVNGSFYCTCAAGYRLDAASGLICTDIDECEEGTHQCDGICINTKGSYHCKCPTGSRLFREADARANSSSYDKWLLPMKSCIPVHCPRLEAPRDGFVWTNNSMLIAGTVVRLYCNEEYYFAGSNLQYIEAYCDSDGDWVWTSEKAETACACIKPETIEYGTFNILSGKSTGAEKQYGLGSVIQYTCDTGYLLQGQQYKACHLSRDGMPVWSGDRPSCQAVDCGLPLYLTNGFYVIGPNTEYESCVFYFCLPSHKLVGQQQRCCTLDGTWSGDVPFCVPHTCNLEGPMPAFLSPKQEFFQYAIGQHAEFYCRGSGFKISGEQSLLCSLQGSFILPPTSASTKLLQHRWKREAATTIIPEIGKLNKTEESCRKPTIKQITSDIYAAENDNLTLACNVEQTCNDMISVLWKKNEGPVGNDRRFRVETSTDNRTVFLHISSAKQNDSGKYSCNVSSQNSSKWSLARHLLLTVSDDSGHIRAVGYRRKYKSTTLAAVYLINSAIDGAKSWKVFRNGDGNGWEIEMSPAPQPFAQVCDKTSLQPFSWIASPFIKVEHSTRIFVELLYAIHPCRNLTLGITGSCTDQFSIFYTESQYKLPIDASTTTWDSMNFKKFGDVLINSSSANGPETGTENRRRTVLSFDLRSMGFYLAILDRGACATIFTFRVYYHACEEQIVGLTVFPTVPAPLALSPPRQVQGRCADDFSESLTVSSLQCSENSSWVGQARDTCICKPGFVRKGNECVVKGPLCFSCSGTIEFCNSKSMQVQTVQCSAGQVCFASLTSEASSMKLTRGCRDVAACAPSVSNASFQACVNGSEECTVCCRQDFCNLVPFRRLEATFDKSLPKCTDTQSPVFANCTIADLVVPIGFDGEPEEVEVPIPTVFDNSGILSVSVSPKNISKRYRFRTSTVVSFEAVDGATNPPSTCSYKAVIKDTTPPTLHCPDKVTVVPIDVDNYWERTHKLFYPSDLLNFSDNVAVTNVSYSLRNGSSIRPYDYVTVNATVFDNEHNSASCTFRLFPVPSGCSEKPLLQMLDDGAQLSCGSSEAEQAMQERICEFRCAPTKTLIPESVTPATKKLRCLSNGQWIEEQRNNHSLFIKPRIPICAAYVARPVELSVEANYTSLSNTPLHCHSIYESAFELLIKQLFLGFCSNENQFNISVEAFTNHTKTNQEVNIKTILHLSLDAEVKRQNPLVTCKNAFASEIKEKLPPEMQRLKTPGCPVADLTQSTHGEYDLSITSSVATCPDGHILSGIGFGLTKREQLALSCIRCPAGTFAFENVCSSCPLGTYQPNEAMSECLSCPSGTSTATERSTTFLDCIALCPPGTYSATTLEPCNACSLGNFQPFPGKTECTRCAGSKTTITTASTSADDCKESCLPGQYSSNGLEPCKPCPRGYFQPNSGQHSCKQCRESLVTKLEGAFSEMNCTAKNACLDPCKNDGSCDAITGQCSCAFGYQGLGCSEAKAFCNELTATANGTSCSCKPGFSGDHCEILLSPCDNNPCVYGICKGNSQNFEKSYSCECHPGFTGENCEKPEDTCSSVCGSNSKCSASPDGAICQCPFKEALGIACENQKFQFGHSLAIDCTEENGHFCAANGNFSNYCTPETCRSNGKCVVEFDDLSDDATVYCLCPPSFTGSNCDIPRNACSSDPCQNGATCLTDVAAEDSYTCACKAGFVGRNCQWRSTLCSTEVRCLNGGTCSEIDVEPFYECQCRSGWSGTNCEEAMDFCSSTPCQNEGSCFSVGEFYACICPPTHEGLNCEEPVDACASNPCGPSATCESINGKFHCICAPRWTGHVCETEIDACKSNPCPSNSTCVRVLDRENSSNSSFHCICPLSYIGETCDILASNCHQNSCKHGQCISTEHGYDCICPPQYTGSVCEIERDLCSEISCLNDGICVMENGSALCNCSESYFGNRCENMRNVCELKNPCRNGGTCVLYTGNATDNKTNETNCLCPPRYSGAFCEKERDENFNLAFFGRPSSDRQQTLADSSLLLATVVTNNDEQLQSSFSLCHWINTTQARTSAVYLTLFNINKDAQKSAVIQFSSSRICVFSADSTAPATFRLNIRDTLWHHICFCFERSDKISRWKITHNGQTLKTGRNLDIWFDEKVQLGLHTDYTAQLSQVTLFGSFLSDELVNEMVFSCPAWQRRTSRQQNILIRWTDFDLSSTNHTKVQLTTPSICQRWQCIPTLENKNNCSNDRTPPTVVSCPSQLHRTSRHRLVRISWPEPEFTDNVNIKSVISNFRSGQTFTWGDYQIVYVAFDDAGNIATCSFRLTVSVSKCVPPPSPPNALVSCSSCDRQARDCTFCKVSCRSGFGFDVPEKPFYACGAEGLWNPRTLTVPFRFPACSKILSPILAIRGSFDQRLSCSADELKRLKLQLISALKQADIEDNVCQGRCEIDSITLTCDATMSSRRTRSTHLELTSNSTITTNSSFANYKIPHFLLPLNSSDPGLSESISRSLSSISIDGLKVKHVNETVDCPIGAEFFNHKCVLCPAGKYFNEALMRCQFCRRNFYQDEMGSVSCKACPENHITALQGSTASTDCMEKCDVGEKWDVNQGECVSCELGTYQDQPGQLSCIPCPNGLTTFWTGRSINDCEYPCEPGFELVENNTCQACDKGTYKSYRNQTACVPCPYGWTTGVEGATDRSECSIRFCAVGSYFDAHRDRCKPCGIGEFQDELNQRSCKRCPPRFTTVNRGTVSARQCVVRQGSCDLYGFMCDGNGTTCADVDGSNDNADSSYECVCSRGFEGDGFNCTHLCELGYCKNDATCSRGNDSAPSCECPSGFIGPQCVFTHLEAQTKTSYVIGGVCGSVLCIIVVIALLIGLKVRFNTWVNCFKRPSLKDITSNEFYRNDISSVSSDPTVPDIQSNASDFCSSEKAIIENEQPPYMRSNDQFQELTPNEVYDEIFRSLQSLSVNSLRTSLPAHFDDDDVFGDNESIISKLRSLDIPSLPATNNENDNDSIGTDYFS